MSQSTVGDHWIMEGHPIRSVIPERAPAGNAGHCTSVKYLCKPSYRWRWFGNKGVAIVLLWSLGAFSAFSYLLKVRVSNPTNSNAYIYLLIISVGSILFPAVGWLADVKIGRYRVVKSCLLLMWMGAILLCLTYIIHLHLYNSRTAFIVMISGSSILLASGIGGFLVNIVQFSIDQLLDSSSVEIVSFITWFMWTYFAAQTANEFLVCIKYFEREIFPLLFVCTLLTASVASDFLFGHWLAKEPVAHNPLRLIFKVLCYAAKNKYPSNMSAFTYWDDKHNSRLDLAKVKYGGPFTTKQVEDVKAFFRNLVFVSLGCLFLAISLYVGSYVYVNASKFPGFDAMVCTEIKLMCVKTVAIENLGYVLLSVCIPLYEFFILPVFWKCLPQLRIFRRMLLGSVFVLLHLSGLLSAEMVGAMDDHPTNDTVMASSCPVHETRCVHDSAYYWLALLSIGYAVGQCYVVTAGLEFVCSQTPYGMKGLTFGWVFAVLGVGITLVCVLFLPFQYTVISVNGTVMGCVFWFLLSCCLLATLMMAGFCAASRWYKGRQRDDDSLNDA